MGYGDEMREIAQLKVETERLQEKYDSAIKVNEKKIKQYEDLVDRVKRLITGLDTEDRMISDLYEELKESEREIVRLRNMVYDLFTAHEGKGFSPLWICLGMGHEEYILWKDKRDADQIG